VADPLPEEPPVDPLPELLLPLELPLELLPVPGWELEEVELLPFDEVPGVLVDAVLLLPPPHPSGRKQSNASRQR
jgi:hypothetical protein